MNIKKKVLKELNDLIFLLLFQCFYASVFFLSAEIDLNSTQLSK